METTFSIFNNYNRNNETITNINTNETFRTNKTNNKTYEKTEKIVINERTNKNTDNCIFGTFGVKREGRTCKNSDNEEGGDDNKEGIEDWFTNKRIKTEACYETNYTTTYCENDTKGHFFCEGAKTNGMDFIRTGNDSGEDCIASLNTAFTFDTTTTSPEFNYDNEKVADFRGQIKKEEVFPEL